jgi:uncharacterized Zn-finger protein
MSMLNNCETKEILDNPINLDLIKPLVIWDDHIEFLYEVSSPSWSSTCSGLTSRTSFSPEEEKLSYFEPLAIEKRHECTYCSRAFSRRHDLERHTRVHTGIKPYQCPSCQKSFARSDARGRHFLSDPACSQNEQVLKISQRKRNRKNLVYM